MEFPLRALLAMVLAIPAGLEAQTAEEYHRRADEGLQTFLLRFWAQGLDYLRQDSPGEALPTGYWTFAQGLDTLLDGVERTGGARYAGLIETFYAAQDRRGWIVDYYDDESWMCVALIRAYDLTGKAKYLERARTLYADIQTGWDQSCCGTRPGGIWWNKPHTQKATASNGGPVIGGARLYQRLHDSALLAFARKVYLFWFQNMVDPVSYQVADHLQPDGSIVRWGFTYNEGLMIGAATELYLATGEARYLQDANHIAGFLLSNRLATTSYGKVLDDGTNQSCGGDCQEFKGPAYRYLMGLYQVTKNRSYLNVLKSCDDAIWNLARNPAEKLYSVSWAGPSMTSFSEPQVTAAVMALNLFAEDSGPYPGSGSPRSRYEAEDATITGVGLEAVHAGYSGWGYVAGFSGNGQRVDFQVHLPGAGRYALVFGYAGGAGNGSRRISIDGVILSANLLFPGTGSWTSYKTVSLPAQLSGSTKTISVVHDSSAGSSNFLNLDYLEARPVETPFVRGDVNADGQEDLSDAIRTLGFLFLGEPTSLGCGKAADANDDGKIDIADPALLLQTLFKGGPPAAEPSGSCGFDPTPDGLSCDAYAPCR
jgi:predicted alpha-1,6-mannanase (GH76 family)